MIRAGVAIVVLALLVVAGLQLTDVRRPAGPADVSTPQGSDYYMLDAVVRQMADDGDPKYRMTVAKTLHYPDDSAQLVDIHVHYFDRANGPWDLYADTGQVPAGKHSILLRDRVRLVRQRPDGETRVTTPHVWVYPDADRVETEARIQAEAPGRRAAAKGMTIHLDSEQITLNQDVRVTYTP